MNQCEICDGKCEGLTCSMACAELFQAVLRNKYGMIKSKPVSKPKWSKRHEG